MRVRWRLFFRKSFFRPKAMSRRPVNLNLNTSRWFRFFLFQIQVFADLVGCFRCRGSIASLANSYSGRGGGGNLKGAVSRVEGESRDENKDVSAEGEKGIVKITTLVKNGDCSCTVEVQRAISILKKAYGDSMHKVLHVGLDTRTVVSKLLSEEETEAWGVEPYNVEDAGRGCKSLVRADVVRVVDIKYPLLYRPKSFSLVLVSDALDYLSERYLNRTLPDSARVSANGLVVFTGYPRKQRAKAAEVSKFGRAAKLRSTSWWSKFFGQISLEENDDAAKKLNEAATKMSYVSNCRVFHLRSFN